MKWRKPPTIKIYEALGAVADGRIAVDGTAAKVYSSSGNKYYDVAYDPHTRTIMANDNGSYWQGYLGYPAIAYLLKTGVIEYSKEMGELLKGISWKDINQRFKNDFDKTLAYILENISDTRKRELAGYVAEVESGIAELGLSMPDERAKPPAGY